MEHTLKYFKFLLLYGCIFSIIQTCIFLSWIFKIYQPIKTKPSKIIVSKLESSHSQLPQSTSPTSPTITSSMKSNDITDIQMTTSSDGHLSAPLGFKKQASNSYDENTHDNNDHSHVKPVNISPSLKHSTTLSLLFSLLYCYWIVFASIIYAYFNGSSLHIFLSNGGTLYGLILINISRILLYYYYLKRLYITFKRSTFEIKRNHYMCYKWLLISIFIVVSILFIVVTIVDHFVVEIPKIWFISLGIGVVFDSIIGIILMVAFVVKLLRLYNMRNGDDNEKIKRVVRKLSILTIVSVVSTQATLAIYIVFDIFYIILLDVIINSLCLLFSYSMYKNYYKIFCFICNLC